jgi:hypothetical protein
MDGTLLRPLCCDEVWIGDEWKEGCFCERRLDWNWKALMRWKI